MKTFKSLLCLQVILLASQGVLAGFRQKRPLDVKWAHSNEDFTLHVPRLQLTNKAMAARGLVGPTFRDLDEEVHVEPQQAVSEEILNALKSNGVALTQVDALPEDAIVADEFEARNVHDHTHEEIEASLRAKGGDGFFCLDKVMEIEEIVYDEEVRCNHVKYNNCYQAYKTVYNAQEMERCEDNFKKDCYIEYEDVAKTEIVRVCSDRFERNCNVQGPVVCQNVTQLTCITSYRSYTLNDSLPNCKSTTEEVCFDEVVNGKPNKVCRTVPKTWCDVQNQNITKTFPETTCMKMPTVVCGNEKCPITNSTNCEDKEKTFVTPVPKERCELQPYQICRNEVMSVPSLQQTHECVDVPKEVCSVEQVNPHRIKRPIVKKWCTRDPTLLRSVADSTGQVVPTTTAPDVAAATPSTSLPGILGLQEYIASK